MRERGNFKHFFFNGGYSVFSFVDILGKFFERDRLAEHYVLLMQRINSFARYKKSHALIIIDNQARNIDKWTAFAFNNFLFRANKGIDLENIVEMPIFADSEMTQGIQVADIAAGIIRHYYDKHITDDNRESGFHRKISEYYQLVEKHAGTHDKRFQPIYRRKSPKNLYACKSINIKRWLIYG
jgi:hypothetical protein